MTAVRFLLNGKPSSADGAPPTMTVLDWLRTRARLTGTKEGCAEGDCGACSVLVGRLRGGELKYEAINGCITFVGSLDGTHVVTVEHLSAANGPLHPVQQAMVDYHGSQCGFCTPGFVMAAKALLDRNPNPTLQEVHRGLSGNFCRCGTYAGLRQAVLAAAPRLAGGAFEEDVEGSDEVEDLAAAEDTVKVKKKPAKKKKKGRGRDG